MDKLYGLPVSGDAFLLQREDVNILVDGGHNSSVLIKKLLQTNEAISHLDIVVCTHADKDHAGGLTDLLGTGLLSVGEFWLPGSWTETLPDLLRDPRQFVSTLLGELDLFRTVVGGSLDEDLLDLGESDVSERFESQIHAHIVKIRREFFSDREEAGIDAPHVTQDLQSESWLEDLAKASESDKLSSIEISKTFQEGRVSVWNRVELGQIDQKWGAFWVSLIDTAERIHKIATQAVRHRVSVRWFDFGKFSVSRNASGGYKNLLVPINSVELLVPPPPPPTHVMMYAIRLSPVNEESLVFYAPPHQWLYQLGVMFTADSPLGDGPGYQTSFFNGKQRSFPPVVATAPHHGSESNQMAYRHLQLKAWVPLWIRSGGNTKHPGKTFRTLPPESRACTHCPRLRLQKEAVEVQLSNLWPIFRVKSHDCICN